MPLAPTNLALLFLIIGNLLAAISDVAVKILDDGASVFQYMFIRQLISVLVILPLFLRLQPTERRLKGASINLLRAHLILVGSGCMMVAITHLPLATANAVFYAAPLLMLPLSLWVLNEKPATGKVIGTLVGFIGVLLVLRPSQFHWAAIFALGTAITLALFNVLVRKLPGNQPVSATLFWTSLFSLPVSGILAWFHWQPLSMTSLVWIVLSAACILSYNGFAVAAYKKAETSQIALAEYSGLLFVTLFGIWWFAEIPDWLTAIGILLIVLPMMPIKNVKKPHSPQ
ncbi:DMT family transporter [Vibrio nigripulchritudo]|uniref:DMT family transporter n=1 Tax=Vibrio nigripulchritudo TaxID=28173 RepID=UPI0003B1FF0A|nr:DMT family transporter [Vibrio nigripulchritudo]CCN73905.1 putative Multidrug resistance efflux transporter EmrE [Vibrio nigripulchritudo SFn118]